MASKTCANRGTAICLLVSAAILFMVSVILLAIFPSIYNKMLKEDLTLVKGTILYPLWRDLPIPIYEKVYFFNITNPKEFQEGGVELSVEEVGPYTYRSSWIKENIRWYPNNTVSYQEKRTNEFVPEKSYGSEDDEIYTLNGPMIIASNLFKNKSSLERGGLSIFFTAKNEHVVTQKTVKQLAFYGYEDPVIKDGTWIIGDLPFKDGVFSWLYELNNTYDGTFTVFTGASDIEKLNVINKWNGKGELPFWKNDSCNMFNGSSGEMGPPLREGQTEFTFFQSLFCRSLTFTYTNDQKHHGLVTKRFAANEKVFGNETVNADNACFDTKPYLPSGVQDISACQFDAPILLSFPHFYLADPSYLNATRGLHPNATAHSSFFDVEPTSGVSVSILVRAQLNLEFEPVKFIPQTNGIPKGVYPILWFELNAEVTDDLLDFFKTSLFQPKRIVYSVVGLSILASLLLFVGGLIILRRSKAQVDSMSEPIMLSKEAEKMYSATYVHQTSPETSLTNSTMLSETNNLHPKNAIINHNEGNNEGDEMLIDVN